MYRKMLLLVPFSLLIGIVGCWGTSTEVKNNPEKSTFVPSPMPETATPDPDPVRITDKSPQGERLKLESKTDDSSDN